MSTENQVPKKPSFGRRMWLAFKNLVWFVFRVLLVLVLIAAVGAAIYFGGPVLINEYLLKDVQVNSSNIEELENQLDLESARLDSRLEDFQERLDALEIQQDSLNQFFSDLEAQLTTVENTVSDHATLLDNMATYGATLENLDASLSNLEAQVSTIESDLKEMQEDYSSHFANIEESLAVDREEIEALNAQLAVKDTTEILRQELELLKVMELITRARVLIGQENIGLAKTDLQAAQDILILLRADVSPDQANYLDDVSQRLSLVIKNISDAPALADEDLEVAWQMLVQGLPAALPEEDATTPAVEEEPEATMTPTPTPTPQP